MENMTANAEVHNVQPRILFYLIKTIPLKTALLIRPSVKYQSLILWAAALSVVNDL